MQVIEKIRQYKSSFLMEYDLETDALCKQPNCIEFMQNSLSNKEDEKTCEGNASKFSLKADLCFFMELSNQFLSYKILIKSFS